MISIVIRVELMFPLLSERQSLIKCAAEIKIFFSVCMVIFFEGKEMEMKLEIHCRSEEAFRHAQ